MATKTQKRIADKREELINEQIADMLSFGIEMDKQKQAYVRSCLNLVWTVANIEGFHEGSSLWKENL